MTRFYSHRKTVKLRMRIGLDAYWIPPRLWAYAAENQPDGNMSGYSSEEIAELLGCLKYATSILEDLKGCGFIDDSGLIHDWADHNGYHEKYSARAKLAARARWAKEKPPTPPKEDIGNRKGESGDKHCLSDATSILQASKVAPLPRFQKPSIEEIKLQAAKIGLSDAEGEKFLNYYEANGWRVGKNPMKSWTHALTNWKNHAHEYGTNNQNGSRISEKRIDRSIGTLNEGVASRYAGIKGRDEMGNLVKG